MNKTEQQYVTVRCKICGGFLFEAEVEATGKIRKKCRGCKSTRTVDLPLTRRAASCSIPVDAEPAGIAGKIKRPD